MISLLFFLHANGYLINQINPKCNIGAFSHLAQILPKNKNKIVLAEIYMVLNFQGCARCATGVACKILTYKKMKNITKKYVSVIILLNHLKNAISVEPISFPEKGF